MKAGAKVLNVFWVIFIGIYSTIVSCIVGAICCVTVIGIPFGIQYFKFTKLAIAPAGKRVVTHFKTRPVLNVLWLIFGGIETYIILCVVGIICMITVVGFPLSVQLLKIANYFLSPFGAEIVNDGEYSRDRKDYYDYEILNKRIVANPQTVITDGEHINKTVGHYLVENYSVINKDYNEVLEKQQKRQKVSNVIYTILVMAYMFVLYLIITKTGIVNMSQDDIKEWAKLIGLFVVGVIPLIVIFTLIGKGEQKIMMEHNHKYYAFLMDYYPVGSPEKKKLKLIQKEIGIDGKATGKLKKPLDIVIEEIQKDFPEYYQELKQKTTLQIVGYDAQTGAPIYAQPQQRKVVSYDAYTGQPVYEGQVIIGYDTQTGAPIYGEQTNQQNQ